MRSDSGKIYRSDSTDYGESWCEAYTTDIPNNNSGIDCVMTENGTLVLVCNPVGENWGARSPLTIFTSTDNGKTFEKQLDLETEKKLIDKRGDGEFAYPAIVSQNKKIYITYTYKRKNIVFCELAL